MAALTSTARPATLLAPSPHAAVGIGVPKHKGAQRLSSMQALFCARIFRYGGLCGAVVRLAGSFVPVRQRRTVRLHLDWRQARRLQPYTKEPPMKSPAHGQNPPKIPQSSARIPNFRVCEKSGRYVTRKPLTDEQIIQAAKRLLERRVFRDTPALTSPTLAADYLTLCLGGQDREQFGVLFLDAQHRPLAFEPLFFGTFNTSYIHGRWQRCHLEDKSRIGRLL